MAGDVRGGDLRSGSTVCLHRREEPARGGAGFRIEPGYDFQNVPLFGAARLCAIQGSGAAEARAARSSHRRDLRSRQDGAAEAKAYGEADFRTAADRTRLRWRLYGREGLRFTRSREVFVPLAHPSGHAQVEAQLAAVKLLIVDELGYVALSQTGAELLFEIFSQRHERGSTIVTSNLPFEEWTTPLRNGPP